MNNVRIILSKELRSYFDSPMAYIFIIIFLLLTGTYFVNSIFLQNVSSLSSIFEIIPVLLLFFAPAITMRLISEEKKSGTFEILGTKPIKMGEMILGKFLAAWILIAFALVPTLIYFFTISVLGNVDLGPLLGGYAGLILLGGAFVGIGLIGSSLSQNQIVSFILSFSFILILFVIDRVLMYVPSSIAPVVEYFGTEHHFSSLARGVVDSRDVLYYISLMVISLLLATIFSGVETVKNAWKLREFGWSQQLPRLVIVLVIVVFLNLLSVSLFARVDLTKDKVYTLMGTSQEMISELEDNFLVKAYFTPDLPPPYHNHRQIVQELLDEYRAFAPGTFHYEFINPLSDPELEAQALAEGITPVQVKVIRNDKFMTDKAYVGLVFSYIDKIDRVPVVESLDQLEYYVTGGMKRLLTSQARKIGVLTGHGEIELSQMKQLQEALARQYTLTTVSTKGGKAVSDDISALIIAGPESALDDREVTAIDQYIMRGGRVAFFMNNVVINDSSKTASPADVHLDAMFETYGWIVRGDLVMDARSTSMSVQWDSMSAPVEVGYPFYPIATDFNPNSIIVKNLSSVTFTYVSSIDTRLAEIRGVKADVLVTSSTQSRRTDAAGLSIDPRQNFQLHAFTEQRIPLAATIEGEFSSASPKRKDAKDLILNSPKTRLVVVGDGDFISDEHMRGHDNISFAANLIDWLVDDVALTSIRSRNLTPKPLNEVAEGTKSLYKYLNFLVPPGVVVFAGILRIAMKAARRKQHKTSF